MKRVRIKKWLAVLICGCGISLVCFANLTYQADSMKTRLARGKERTLLDGNVHINSDDVDIIADHVELYGEDNNIILCQGNIEVLNYKTGVYIRCEDLYYDRAQKMIRITGNALMEDKENEIVIKGGYIENWDERNETIIQIGVSILKENLVCRAESARYYREAERLELSGMPVVIKDGDEFRALKINIDLKNDDVEMEGNVSGELILSEEENPDKEEPAPEVVEPAKGEAPVPGELEPVNGEAPVPGEVEPVNGEAPAPEEGDE